MLILCHFGNPGFSELVDRFAICVKVFLEVIGPFMNLKQELSLDSKTFIGFRVVYYGATQDTFHTKLKK